MTIFTKNIDALTTEDLAALLSEQAVENVRLEFKREVPAKDETLKKISSFANTLGGIIVVGADAPSDDGRLRTLPGVTAQASYKQQIVQWCFEGTWPPIEPLVSAAIPSPADSSRVCYVIEVPISPEAPHYLNGRKGAYIRTNEFSQRFEARFATYDEIEHLRNRREVVVQRRLRIAERAKERFAQYTKAFHATAPASDGRPGAMVFLGVEPPFPSRPVLEGGRLLDLVRSTSVAWRQVGFPRANRFVTQLESVLAFNPGVYFSLLEASTYGSLFYAREIEEEREVEEGQPTPHLIHLYSFVGHLLVWLEHARRLVRASPYRGPLSLRLSLSGIRGLPFMDFSQNNRPIPRGVSVLDDEVTVESLSTTERLIDARNEVAKQLLSQLAFAVDWPDVSAEDPALEQLLERGFVYNFWTDQRGQRVEPA